MGLNVAFKGSWTGTMTNTTIPESSRPLRSEPKLGDHGGPPLKEINVGLEGLGYLS